MTTKDQDLQQKKGKFGWTTIQSSPEMMKLLSTIIMLVVLIKDPLSIVNRVSPFTKCQIDIFEDTITLRLDSKPLKIPILRSRERAPYSIKNYVFLKYNAKNEDITKTNNPSVLFRVEVIFVRDIFSHHQTYFFKVVIYAHIKRTNKTNNIVLVDTR